MLGRQLKQNNLLSLPHLYIQFFQNCQIVWKNFLKMLILKNKSEDKINMNIKEF